MILMLFLQLAVVGFPAASEAAVRPVFQIEPPVGVANGSVVAIGTGFTPGQAVTVSNETTSATVCSATAASDGTFSCNGLAGAVPGTISKIGVGTSFGRYRAAGVSGIATVAGGGLGDGGRSTAAVIDDDESIASDTAGDVFFAETADNIVRRIDAATGVITTVAGVGLDVPVPYPPAGDGGDGGPATLAHLNQPSGVAVDQHGDLFIADFGSNRVREVTAATGIITTVAGDGTAGFSGDGGPATQARLDEPEGLAVDSHGDLFIGDARNCRIREVSAATGIITTVAGSRCGYGGDGGPATSAELASHLPGLVVDSNGDLFIADYDNNRVREVAAGTGTITTIAGNGSAGYTGDNGLATKAELTNPSGVALTPAGNLLISDSNNLVIRQVNRASGIITTVAGDGTEGFGGDGGPATSAQLSVTLGVATDQSGDFFIADNGGDGFSNVRRVDGSTGVITTLASGASTVCSAGPAPMARDTGVFGVALDSLGDIFFSEGYANVVCEVDASTGDVSIIAGQQNAGKQYGGDGGPATSADLFEPFGLALHGSDLYIADYQNYRVRRVDLTTGTITTVAGDGIQGDTGNGGPATAAEISDPSGLAVDQHGNLYISGGGTVREVSAATGIISAVVSAGGQGIALDNHGHLFLASGGLQKLTLSTARLTTVSGVGPNLDSVAADTSGNVFVAGQSNWLVQRVHLATGAVTTIAGTGQEGYSGDGGPATSARLFQVMGIAGDSSDDVFIGELYTGRVREVIGGPALQITSPPVSGRLTGAPTIGPVTVTEQDTFGNPVTAPPGGTTVTLASTSRTGVFAATSAGPPATEVTIPPGASSTTFFYGDTTVGTPRLTASATGYASTSQQATITPLPPTPPLDVRASAGDSKATITWARPASDGQAPITSYTATASPGGATCTRHGPGSGHCTVTGLASGTPYTFTVTARNRAGQSPPSAPTTPVTPYRRPAITTTSLPPGVKSTPYSATLKASYGTGAYTWSVTGGSLPPGLSLSLAGIISGTPNDAGRFDFTVTVTDAALRSASKNLSITIAPAPVGDDDYFNTDSCATSGFCMAVGAYLLNGHQLGQSAMLSGGRWVSEPVPSPSRGVNVFANEVSCASPTRCVFVGEHWASRNGPEASLAEVWDGSSWRVVIASGPPATAISALDDVSCPTTRFCMATGLAGGRRTYQGTAFTSNDGTTWRRLAVPRPRGARNSELSALACFNPANCMAVGIYTSASGHSLPYAARWHDRRWELRTAPAVPRQRLTIFQGISCPAATSCLAVGDTVDNTRQGFYHAFAEIWSGGRWRLSTLRRLPSYFIGVSCPARNRCFASGTTFRRSVTSVAQPLVETWNGRTWTVQHPIRTARPRYGDFLQHVSCVTRSRCEAVGGRFNPRVRNSDQTLAEIWNGHHWTVQTTTNP